MFNSSNANPVSSSVSSAVSTSPIFEKCVVLSLKLKKFNLSRKADKSKFQTEADLKWVGFRKKILESPELKAISDLYVEIYQWINWKDGNISLPSIRFQKGQYLILYQDIEMVESRLKAYAQQLEKLKALIPNVYLAQVEESKTKLGPLWRAKDYPKIQDVLGRISMEWYFEVISFPNNMEGVSSQLFQDLKCKMEERLGKVEREATVILRSLLVELFKGIADKFTPGKKGRRKPISDDYLKELRASLDSLIARDLFDDKILQQNVEFLRQKFSNVTVDSLKSDEDLRQTIKIDIDAALAAFDQMVADDCFDDLSDDIEQLMADDGALSAELAA